MQGAEFDMDQPLSRHGPEAGRQPARRPLSKRAIFEFLPIDLRAALSGSLDHIVRPARGFAHSKGIVENKFLL
jgi:hypothetical protein